MIMNEAIEKLLENIKEDYYNWFAGGVCDDPNNLKDHQVKMIDEFNEGLDYIVGNKYIKVVTKTSVWGFIVNVHNDKKFEYGDILKAAGYNAPARNAARGNIYDEEYTIRWTGPLYL